MNKIKILDNIEKYTILLTVFLYPIILLTIFTNIFETPKLLVLSTSVGILALVKIVKIFFKESVEINVGKFDIFMILFGLTFLISGVLISPNKMDAFLLPGSASFIILSALIYFFVNQSKEIDKKGILTVIIASIFTASVIQILAVVGITKLIPFLPEIIKSKNFTPFGSLINSAIITTAMLPIVFYKTFTNKEAAEKILYSLVGLIMSISIASSAYLILISKESPFYLLNYKTGWSIAIDSIKESPLLGVGPSNFSYAFNKFRPISFNNENNWNLKYLQNSGQFLNTLSEVGIIGAVLIIYLCFLLYKNRDLKNPVYVSAILLLTASLLLPISVSSYLILFVLLSTIHETKNVKLGLLLNKLPKIFIAIPTAMILLTFAYFTSRAFYAEYVFAKAISHLNNDQGLLAYEQTNKAVLINPYVDRYHLFSAAINMALAESLASKADLTDEDRNNVSKLIQQAIREGKASVAVNPKKSANWEALSDIYKSIIAFAKGSEDFAVESLKQAVALDPINPNLRIKLGSLFFSLKDTNQAIDAFKLATLAKPNLPNAHYNLALAYKAAKDLTKAKEEINITLSLLGKESADYETALKELQNIEELSKPAETVEPAIEPQIELPQETTTEEPQI